MLTQLNRLIALMALCGLLIRPAMAGSGGSQTLVVVSDSLVVPVLGEPLPVDDPSLVANGDSLSAQAKRKNETGAGKRIAKKLIRGPLWGIPVGVGAGYSLEAIAGADGPDGLGGGVLLIYGGFLGYITGTAIGVSQVDPQDNFIMSLLGSLIGFYGGAFLPLIGDDANEGFNIITDSLWELWRLRPLFVGSVLGATIMSELSRLPLPSKASSANSGIAQGVLKGRFDKLKGRFSVGLVPDTRGNWSAVARMRF